MQQQQVKQIELVDLDWEDRERVLRLLFAKMNTGQPATHWRTIGSSRPGGTTGRVSGGNALNQSFREEDEDEENGAYFATEAGANIFDKEIGREMSSDGFK